jgi:CheY-like chemotaxis protein
MSTIHRTPPTSNGVILLVEDNPDDVDLALRAFERSNIKNEVVVVQDGVEALDYLRGTDPAAALPEVVLLDLNLPKMHGLEVLRRLRVDERTRLLPVVVLTSSAEERDVIESYGLGANSYVRKPVDFVQFLEAARQLGLYWLVLNRPAMTPSFSGPRAEREPEGPAATDERDDLPVRSARVMSDRARRRNLDR